MSIAFESYDVSMEVSIFEETISLSNYQSRFLPLITRSCHKKTLVLDLDETLVHSSQLFMDSPDDIVTVSSNNESKTLYVKYRPGLIKFLLSASQKFELVIFTASSKMYAEQILNKLDPQRRLLKYRLYREDCIYQSGHYIKDLSRLGRDLSQVVIMDNSISAFVLQLNNGIPISS